MVDAERTYNSDLKTLQNFRIEKCSSLSKEETNLLFSNLSQLIQLSDETLFKLNNLAKKHDYNIGGMFYANNFAKKFSIYAIFLNNYEQAMGLFAEKNLTREVDNYMIRPVQMITRYKLFLENLLKEIPLQDPLRKDCDEGYLLLSKVLTDLNESKRNHLEQVEQQLLQRLAVPHFTTDLFRLY